MIGPLGFLEREHAIDHRLDVVRCYCGVHGLEHLRRSNRNALNVGTFCKYPAGVDLSWRSAQNADDADLAAAANGVERWPKRGRAADIDYKVNAFAAGEF